MSRLLVRQIAWLALAGVAMAFAWLGYPPLQDAAWWRQHASPGALSQAHAFLESECSACHVTLAGVPAAQCVACHAGETALLQRQATAFHADVGACADCHREHQGRSGPAVQMDHAALARIGLDRQARSGTAARVPRPPSDWIGLGPDRPVNNPHLSALEARLQCSTCHATKDRHQGQFGTDCADCHALTQWTLAEFRHPSPSSQDCAQCHQAPPSHYMEHFRMMSMPIARQAHAEVRQCYLCHQTTSWNDIRGVGFFDHH